MIVDERMVTYINSRGTYSLSGGTGGAGETESCSHYPQRDAEFFKVSSGGSKTSQDFRGGNGSGIFCASDVRI